MDLLTQAANSVFSVDADEDLYLPLTPTKGIPLTPSKLERPAFAELTNTINISPEKFCNSPLQALFTAPTLSTPKTKAHNLITISNAVGSRNVGRGSAGKSFSCPSPGNEVGTPKFKGIPPSITNSGGSGTSPLTPMTNLKLLTRIASMEESMLTCSKKVLFGKENQGGKLDRINVSGTTDTRATSTGATALRKYNSECLGRNQYKSHKKSGTTLRKHPTSDSYPAPSSPGNLVLEGIGRIPSIDDSASRPLEVSRKDKSLGLLSEKFLEQFPLEVSYLETPRRLVIDEVAAMLGTERRRVYDIINVLESLNMAARVQKNMYQWTGKLHLEETLGRLKALGEKYDIASKLQALENEGKDFKVPQQIKLTRIGDCENVGDSRKEKSLSILCQKFIMILLVSPEPHVISLDNAVRLLVGEVGEDGERLRTRGRRLYDIANVLTSLGLVRRVPAAKSFQYIGPAVEAITNDEDTYGIMHKNSLLPSRNAIGESKENISTYGNHDVTPSEVPPPIQKRGRPRKLSTAFTTSALPAPKRSRLQRTQSEDVISHQSRKITRNPSLHDICQVAEVERKKLIREQQAYRSRSSDRVETDSRRSTKTCPGNKEVVLPKIDFRPISSAPSCSSILQRRLTKRAKIPVALTFEGSRDVDANGREMVNSPRTQAAKQNAKNSNFKTSSSQKLNASPCQYPKPLREVTENESSQKVMRISAASESISNNHQLITNIHPVKIIQPICNQSQRNQADQTRKPIVIVKNSTTSNNSYSQSQVIPIGPSGTQVIKVITKTSTSKDNDASTVMTVLPASQPLNSTLLKPKHIIRNSNGCFQQVSEGTYSNGQRITISTSSQMGVSGSIPSGKNSEAKPVNAIPYVVYTVSNNLAGQRTLSKVSSIDAAPVSSQQACPLQQLSHAKSWETTPSGLASLTTAPLSQGSRDVKCKVLGGQGLQQHQSPANLGSVDGFSVNSGTWQPSPDGSSTDSELEQIFGDTFNFSRPKLLIHTNTPKTLSNDRKN